MPAVTIKEISEKYHKKINYLDLELIIAHVLKKPREFVLAHPEFKLTKNQKLKTKNFLARRAKGEPLAYILGHKEFFGLDFKVVQDTLIPRPETELLVELAIRDLKSETRKKNAVIDVGTGSGNIIISIANQTKDSRPKNSRLKYLAVDVSAKALRAAESNARKHKVSQKIKFLKGDLLTPIIQNKKLVASASGLVILANLPYLSKEAYRSAMPEVKKYEPRTALVSPRKGLGHYEKLFEQIKKMKSLSRPPSVACYLEFSPEQKSNLSKLIKSYFPKTKPEFIKDLAGKWRVCAFKI